jgi:hypothetical protein
MSLELQIIRAKPNPIGEDPNDKTYLEPQFRKAGEWFDIKNFSFFDADLKGIEVFSLEYTKDGPDWKKIFAFKDDDKLKARKTIRIHAGQAIPLDKIADQDAGRIEYHYNVLETVDKHYFMGNGYVLSNSSMDKIALFDANNQKWIDEVYYDKFPGKDTILEREDDKLVEIHTKQEEI